METSTARETHAEGSGCTRVGTRAKADLEELKAETIVGNRRSPWDPHVEHQSEGGGSAPRINFLEKFTIPRNHCKAGRSAGGGKAVMAETCLWRRADSELETMSKILNLRSSKNTLLQVNGVAMEAVEVEDTAEVKLLIS